MIYESKLLTDKSRLKEIYDLRVVAYEASPYKEIINSNLYPNGWSDNLDEISFHWIIESEKKIIASARLTIIEKFDSLLDIGIEINENILPQKRPFGLFARLIISEKYRGLGLSKKLDQIRIKKLEDLKLSFSIVTCNPDRVKPLSEQGFLKIGEYIDKQSIIEEKLSLLILKSTK